jgi:hypothetical protein
MGERRGAIKVSTVSQLKTQKCSSYVGTSSNQNQKVKKQIKVERSLVFLGSLCYDHVDMDALFAALYL